VANLRCQLYGNHSLQTDLPVGFEVEAPIQLRGNIAMNT
jgi:hypothetical protein